VSALSARAVRILHVGPFDCDVAAGACTALHGPSGSGKSLLLRALADLAPHAGAVLVAADAQTDMSGPAWRRRVGYLPTESAWWADSVGEHFRGPVPAELGFEPDVGDWAVSRLSSGERQRLALLRLLDRRPEALLLDEPTANLDPDARGRVEALLARYRVERGAAVLLVSHDPEQRARMASAEIAL